MEDLELTIECYQKAKEIYNQFGNHFFDYSLFNSIGMTYAWFDEKEDALKYYIMTDSLAKKNESLHETQKLYIKYNIVSLLDGDEEKHELAQFYYDQVIPHLDIFDTSRRDRIYIDYLRFLCLSGRGEQALIAFENIKDDLENKGGGNYNMFSGFYADCLVGAGRLEEAMEMNRIYRVSTDRNFKKRRKKVV